MKLENLELHSSFFAADSVAVILQHLTGVDCIVLTAKGDHNIKKYQSKYSNSLIDRSTTWQSMSIL